MRRVIILSALGVVLALAPANGQQVVGSVGIYTDAIGTDCMLSDSSPATVDLHFIAHGQTLGLGAIHFIAQIPGCWIGAVYVSEVWPNALYVIGDTQSPARGVLVSLGLDNCEDTSRYLCTVQVSTQGTADPCCEYPILKAPDDGYPEIPYPVVATCDNELGALGTEPRSLIVNGDAGCFCHLAVPVETTTWGRVKSLYE